MAEKYPLRIDWGILAKPRWVDLACSSVKHGGKRINGNLTFNGELSYLTTELPSGEPATLFWTDRANTLLGAVCGKPVEIEVLPACLICGNEEHGDEECLYLPLLNGCPVHTETPENDIMEVSPPRPDRKPKPQKKTVSFQTHPNAGSNRGRGTNHPGGSNRGRGSHRVTASRGKPAPPGGKKAAGV
ncbi:hypothetical protein PTTG_01633 [Puccinia triticina 1-1 BBBD Race 1]|uniref:Uncharacterized protein n=1 Tax=Puccinia triticina (isolate 1-1 / race 1 (BBBD)) TaxID=630390 RepID=A0A180G234_PUCT1|nr:hypothetical protein PTTG_01633 [Puccinia triticina 1-1 BBBD Race 1]